MAGTGSPAKKVHARRNNRNQAALPEEIERFESAMNLADAEIMLYSWGAYMRGNQHLAISSISPIGRCMVEGAGASHSTVQGEAHMPVRVELVERCLLEQPGTIVRVCKHRYIGGEPDVIAAKKLRISLDIYESIVDQAVRNVAEFVRISA